MREAATAILVVALLGLAFWPALVDRIARRIRRAAWVLRVHAHATRHYGKAFGRQYRRGLVLRRAS